METASFLAVFRCVENECVWKLTCMCWTKSGHTGVDDTDKEPGYRNIRKVFVSSMWTVLDQTTLMQKNICFSRSRVVAHRPCPKLEMFCQSILQLFYGCSKVLVTNHGMKPKTVWRFELSYLNLWPFDSDWNLVFPDYENEIYHFVGVLN